MAEPNTARIYVVGSVTSERDLAERVQRALAEMRNWPGPPGMPGRTDDHDDE